MDLSRIEVTRDDVDKAILGVATAARLVRPAVRSSRLPIALGFLAVAALATFALLSRRSVRDRLAVAARDAQRRVDEARGGPAVLDIEDDIALEDVTPDAIGIPIEPDAFADVPESVADAIDEVDGTVACRAMRRRRAPADPA